MAVKYPRIIKTAKDSVTIQLGPECQFIVNALVTQIEVIGDHGQLAIIPDCTNTVRIAQKEWTGEEK